MSELAFQAKGRMSMKDACLEIFRAMQAGDWVANEDLVAQVSTVTEIDCSPESVRSAAWAAREALASAQEAGVEFHMGGYKRLDTAGKVVAVNKRIRRVRRAVSRVASWAGAALADPELSSEERHRMQSIERAEFMQAEIEARRARRHRPLPPVERFGEDHG